MSGVDGEIAEGLIYGALVLLVGQERADRWRPRLPYIMFALVVVFVLAIFGAVMTLL